MTPMNSILHPVRLRIIQYAASRETFMVSDLSDNLPDVPKASLYRHVRALAENDILQTVNQFKVRGTVQNEYSLNRDSIVPGSGDNDADARARVFGILGKLMNDFHAYFSQPNPAPMEDRLFLSLNSLYLDDASFEQFIEELLAVVQRYTKQPSKSGKNRMIAIVSSPAEKHSEEEHKS